MELLWLSYFKKVAETGKIAAAADSLFISAPSLSATIGRLEKELGVRLFDRTNNSITLNEQGKILLKYTNQIFSCLDLAKDELRKSLDTGSSHISIAATLSNLWVGLICAFSAESPHITVSNTSLKLSQLQGGKVPPQYSFILAEARDFDYSANYNSLTLISDDRPVLMVNPAHPLAMENGIDLRKIQGETYYLPVADMSLNRIARELLEMSNQKLKGLYEYPYMLRKGLISDNRGISFSTEYASKAEDRSIRYIPIENPSYRMSHVILWDKNRELTEEEEVFLQFCVDYFKVPEK